MTKKVSQPSMERYIVPARQLSGTRDEVLAQIDELILGLTGLRQLVSLHLPTPAEAPRRKLHLVKGFLKVLFVIGLAYLALQHPIAALVVASILLGLIFFFAAVIFRTVRRWFTRRSNISHSLSAGDA